MSEASNFLFLPCCGFFTKFGVLVASGSVQCPMTSELPSPMDWVPSIRTTLPTGPVSEFSLTEPRRFSRLAGGGTASIRNLAAMRRDATWSAAVNSQARHAFDVWTRRQWGLILARLEYQFLRLATIQFSVAGIGPHLQVLDLFLARVCVGARNDQVRVVSKLENAIPIVYGMQVGRRDDVGCWS